MAGGTGGHIMPGLAVADVLRARGWRVLWLGNPDGMEGRLVPARGYRPWRAWLSPACAGAACATLLRLPLTPARALAAGHGARLSRIKPDVVLGMGGYMTFPGRRGGARCAACRWWCTSRTPWPASANRWLARVARRVLSGFPGVLPRGEMLGNPVRRVVAANPSRRSASPAANGPLRAAGGGRQPGRAGPQRHVVPQALAALPEQRPASACGAPEQASSRSRRWRGPTPAAGVRSASCRAFIDDMAGASWPQADLMVCRAGAMTVTEMAAVGAAALFVPFPAAVDDHQTTNARFLVRRRQAAWLRAAERLTPNGWPTGWASAPGLNSGRRRAGARARAAQAADDIADVCEQAARKK